MQPSEGARVGSYPMCYALRRQDKAHYAGNREKVLARDGYRCRIPGCQIAGNQKRTLAFRHKVPRNSHPDYFVPRPRFFVSTDLTYSVIFGGSSIPTLLKDD